MACSSDRPCISSNDEWLSVNLKYPPPMLQLRHSRQPVRVQLLQVPHKDMNALIVVGSDLALPYAYMVICPCLALDMITICAWSQQPGLRYNKREEADAYRLGIFVAHLSHAIMETPCVTSTFGF